VIFLGATGMVSAVGLNAPASCAAIRAGIAGFTELPYKDKQRRPVIGATVPHVDLKSTRVERLVEMLGMATRECLEQQTRLPPVRGIPLLVGLAEAGRPAGGAPLAETIVGRVEAHIGMQFHRRLSGAITTGHTAGFELLERVRQLMMSEDIPGCVVAAVDSYINGTSLMWLEQQWRLKREGHSNGVIPGEAAAAVYIDRQTPGDGSAGIRLLGLGFAREAATIMSEEPLLGVGLTAAARSALAESNLKLHDMDFRLSDATGESYGFKELAQVVARLHRVWKEEVPHWHCADSIGDTGAAAGICQLVLGADAFRRGYAFGDRAICFTSGVADRRAVAVIERCATGNGDQP